MRTAGSSRARAGAQVSVPLGEAAQGASRARGRRRRAARRLGRRLVAERRRLVLKCLEHVDRNLSGPPRELFEQLVTGAFGMYDGLVDQQTLATTDFLTNPHRLLEVVREGVAGKDGRVQLRKIGQ